MRHLNKGRKLKRTASHRKSLMESLATSLILYKQVRTTLAKAKEMRTFVEPLITKAKKDGVAARRHVSRFIKNREAVKILFGEIAPKAQEGGLYARCKVRSTPWRWWGSSYHRACRFQCRR